MHRVHLDQPNRRVTSASGIPLWTTREATADEVAIPWRLLVLITAGGIALRAMGLNGGLWFDEILTLIMSVRSPLSEIVTLFPSNNQHTLFSVLAHMSIAVFGEHAWSLRLPAMVLGAATVPALYVFGREFVGRSEALLATLLLAVTYHHVWFSQNGRGYSALALLTVTSSWLLLRGLRRERTADFVWYAITAALGVYAHLTMVFLVVSHALLCVVLLGPPWFGQQLKVWRRPALGFTLAGVLTLLLYSPILFDVQQFFVERAVQSADPATPAWAALELIRGLQIGLGAWLGALAGACLAVVGVWSYFRQSAFLLGLFLLPGVLTVGVAVLLHRPTFPRFLFFLVGFGVLVLIRGALVIGRLLQRQADRSNPVPPLGVALVGAMAAASLVALIPNYRYPKQDFEGALHFVEAHRVGRDRIVTIGATTYVYRQFLGQKWAASDSAQELQRLRSEGERIWAIYTLPQYIAGATPDLMKILRDECQVAGVFRGTVGNGDVTVCSIPPAAGNRTP